MIVHVATGNRMKRAAVRKAFARFFGRVRVVGVAPDPDADPCPDSLPRILRGARARARRGWGECDFSVGIEAGIFRTPGLGARTFMITLACVYDGRTLRIGSGPFFEAPRGRLRKGARPPEGIIAVMTGGRIVRETVTRDAVMMALAPFVKP